jgi:S-disulfanyl-L-cysteine oxidoreductase SoxD
MIRTAFLALVVAAMPALGQTAKKPSTTKTGSTKTASNKTAAAPAKTTLSGVYTREEADAGKELYAPLCSSCHLAMNQHSTPEFRKKWTGKSLSDLYTIMRSTMPKNDPGSLADEDYAVVLAYMLQLNKMPAGKTYLSTDTLELRKIRFDTVRTVQKP